MNLQTSIQMNSKRLLVLIFLIVLVLPWTSMAHGQTRDPNSLVMNWAGETWIEVARSTYPGGTVRMAIPFAVEIEARQLAVVVPQYCAPRALASRATIVDDFSHFGRERQVDLRWQQQTVVGGTIRAFYAVFDPYEPTIDPLVTGVSFSFAPVLNRPNQACSIRIFARL